jgi:hypothetical protein
VIRAISVISLLVLLLPAVWAAFAEAAEYDFDIPEADQKPYELGGRLELRYLNHFLDSDAARYKLSYYNDDPGSYSQQWGALTEIRGAYRSGILQANLLTHHEWEHTEEEEEWINELCEGYLSLTPTAQITLEAGKKSILWGKGYAWNPTGFINRPKDPDDPELNLEGRSMLGVDIVESLSTTGFGNLGLTAYLLPVVDDWANPELGQDGDIFYAFKLYLLWKETDLDFIFFDGPDQPAGYGFDFSKNLAENIEAHGELAVKPDAQRIVLDDTGRANVSRKEQLSYLLGLRYLNAYDTTFIAEYYHNGAGYSRSELDDFFAYQDKAYTQRLSNNDPAIMARADRATRPYYSQRNFGQDYFYLKTTQKEPFDILYLNPWLATIVNLTDFSFNLQPGLTWAPVTNLQLDLRIGIPVGPPGTEFGEKQDSLRPELRLDWYF